MKGGTLTMAKELDRFAMSNRYQMTFYMGSGAPGAERAARLMKQTQRLKIADPTTTLRVALMLLENTAANDPALIEAINKESAK